jgi:predicted DNA-binding ArsR family transcriptional regulator
MATLAELSGTLKIYSKADADLQEQVRELEKAMEEDEDFDPLKWRNN